MSSIVPNLSLQASLRSLLSASSSPAASATPVLTQDRAFTAFSSAILGALGANGSSGDSANGRVGDVALALKNALENPGASGDVVGSLLNSVQAALAQASKALGGAGYSSDAIQSFVTQFTNALSDQLSVLANQAAAGSATAAPVVAPAPVPASLPAPASSPAPAPPSAATPAAGNGAYAAQFRQTESGTLQLQTTEGDIVTIGFRNSQGGSVVGASASGAAGLAAYASVSSFASSRFTVSVQGSLNADELKAINDVLGQVNSLASQFFSGNVTQAFASAATLGADPREIAGFALNLNETTTLRLATVGDGSAAPATAPADAVAASAAAPADPSAAAPATAAAPVVVPATTTDPATAPDSVGGGVSSLLDYVHQLLNALGTSTTGGSVTFSAKAKLELLVSAVSAASITSQEATAAALLKSVAAATTDASAPAAAAAPATTSAAAA
jgi:hypothetical protein